jgi:uncharacterized protein YqhQ
MARINIGGQAVIEGVMMRGPSHWALAVRKNDGEIAIREQKINNPTEKYPFLKWPIFRGIVMLVQSLVIGMKVISYSANMVLGEDEGEEGGDELSTWQMVIAFVSAFVFSAVLFIALPYFLTAFLKQLKTSHFLFTAAEGFVRISIFVAYIAGISLLKDIRRVFQYHGAEHKVINAFDNGVNPTVESVKEYSTIHPSCGTSFLLLVLVIAILVFSFLPVNNYLLRFAGKILVIPIISGISYEIIRFVRKHPKSFLKYFLYPGFLLQKITTRQPDDQQVEVSLAAFNRVVELELQNKC